MTKVTDPTSRAVALVYDSSGHLVTVKTPSGQEKKFAYDSSGHLTGITDADGAQSTYTYDGNHMLKGITDPYGYHLYVNWVRPEAYGAWRVSAVLEKAGGEEGMRLGLDYGYNRTKGSLLAKVTGDSLEATYTYDASGIRTSKTVNGVKTEYLTAGGSILAEKKNGKWQQYLYDGSGQLMAIRYKGADYYYIRDGLMCITGLVDANGGAVVNYRYDSWGKLISITGSMAGTLGKDNPYRYKGYYYDDETGLYKNLK